MASRTFVLICLVAVCGRTIVAAVSLPTTDPSSGDVAATPTVATPAVPLATAPPGAPLGQGALSQMVTDLSRSMADVYALLQSELRTLTSQMQQFATILNDVKTAMAVLQAKRPQVPQIAAPMPMYISPMTYPPQYPRAPMMAPTAPMGFAGGLLPQMQMQMQMPHQAPQPPQGQKPQQPQSQTQPSQQTGQQGQQQSSQKNQATDLMASMFGGNPMMTMLAGMTGSMPPAVPPMPNPPPGVDGTAGLLQAMMGASSGGGGSGGNAGAASAMAAAMAGAGAGPTGPGGRRRPDPTEMEGADMLMLMSMSGMFA